MAGKKKKKTTKSRSKKKKPAFSLRHELIKILSGTVILIFVAATLAMVADYYLNKKTDTERVLVKSEKKSPGDKKNLENKIRKKKALAAKKKLLEDLKLRSREEIIFEVFEDTPGPEDIKREIITLPSDGYPQVAIIIDDVGFDKKMAENMVALDKNITLSILPQAPFGREIAESLHAKGTEIMLHLPMEPMEYPEIDPGPGAILVEMTPDELLEQLRENLDALPYIAGVNNHMGSRLTSLSPQLYQIFTVLKRRDLFFIDSRTSKETLCRPSAGLLKVPFAQRDVFLDNSQELEYIRGQLRKLIKTAERHGTAIGIGHPYPATYSALKKEISALKTKVRIVPASSLAVIAG